MGRIKNVCLFFCGGVGGVGGDGGDGGENTIGGCLNLTEFSYFCHGNFSTEISMQTKMWN